MSICELYKDEDITIRIKGNVFHGPIKRMYQTFYDKTIQVPYLDEWYNAKIIGKASEKEIYCLNGTLMCTMDLLANNRILIDTSDISFRKTDIVSDWLFGIEFEDKNNIYYTLTNGITISTK